MSNATTHGLAGGASGAIVSLATCEGTSLVEACAALLTGMGLGYLGGRAADLLEPASHPNHRGPAHSAAVGVGLFALARSDSATEWARRCRFRAAECRLRAESAADDPLARFGWLLAEFFWLSLATALKTFVAGYVSHLVLDARTARSLPLLCAQF
jgi:hypothetical protein